MWTHPFARALVEVVVADVHRDGGVQSCVAQGSSMTATRLEDDESEGAPEMTR